MFPHIYTMLSLEEAGVSLKGKILVTKLSLLESWLTLNRKMVPLLPSTLIKFKSTINQPSYMEMVLGDGLQIL